MASNECKSAVEAFKTLLERPENWQPYCHGTDVKNLPKIMSEGLKPPVHFGIQHMDMCAYITPKSEEPAILEIRGKMDKDKMAADADYEFALMHAKSPANEENFGRGLTDAEKVEGLIKKIEHMCPRDKEAPCYDIKTVHEWLDSELKFTFTIFNDTKELSDAIATAADKCKGEDRDTLYEYLRNLPDWIRSFSLMGSASYNETIPPNYLTIVAKGRKEVQDWGKNAITVVEW